MNQHFSSALAYKHLVSSLKTYLSDPTDTNRQKELRSSMKTLEYIFKFIIQSRILQRNQEKKNPNASQMDEAFRSQLKDLLEVTTFSLFSYLTFHFPL